MRVPAADVALSPPNTPHNRDRMIEAIYASAGALKDVDTGALPRTPAEERAQDSTGRPAS